MENDFEKIKKVYSKIKQMDGSDSDIISMFAIFQLFFSAFLAFNHFYL